MVAARLRRSGLAELPAGAFGRRVGLRDRDQRRVDRALRVLVLALVLQQPLDLRRHVGREPRASDQESTQG